MRGKVEQRISEQGLELIRILKLRLAWQVAEGTILKLSNLGSYSKYLQVYILTSIGQVLHTDHVQ